MADNQVLVRAFRFPLDPSTAQEQLLRSYCGSARPRPRRWSPEGTTPQPVLLAGQVSAGDGMLATASGRHKAEAGGTRRLPLTLLSNLGVVYSGRRWVRQSDRQGAPSALRCRPAAPRP